MENPPAWALPLTAATSGLPNLDMAWFMSMKARANSMRPAVVGPAPW